MVREEFRCMVCRFISYLCAIIKNENGENY